jgi:hypothetical protein
MAPLDEDRVLGPEIERIAGRIAEGGLAPPEPS